MRAARAVWASALVLCVLAAAPGCGAADGGSPAAAATPDVPMWFNPDQAVLAEWDGFTADYPVRLASTLGGRVLLSPIGVGYTEVLAVVPG